MLQVQEKCHEEVLWVVGTGRFPNMADKPKMVYLEATIMETMRIAQTVPFVPHATADDVTLRGYHIPRDIIVLVNLSSVMTDPDIWGDPDNFRPERFISPDGSLVKREEWIPFGTGKMRVVSPLLLAIRPTFVYTHKETNVGAKLNPPFSHPTSPPLPQRLSFCVCQILF
jgi:hypothetical protein